MDSNGLPGICGSCKRAGAMVVCTQCKGNFHSECIPARTSRSGLYVKCAKCEGYRDQDQRTVESVSRMDTGSVKSGASAHDQEMVDIGFKRIKVKRQLLEINRERLGVPSIVVQEPEQGAGLSIPAFRVGDTVDGTTGEFRVAPTKIPHEEVVRNLKEQELQLELEELELKAEDARLRSLQQIEQAVAPTPLARSEVQVWVNSITTDEGVDQKPQGEQLAGEGAAEEKVKEMVIDSDALHAGRRDAAETRSNTNPFLGPMGGLIVSTPERPSVIIANRSDHNPFYNRSENPVAEIQGIRIPDHKTVTPDQRARRLGGIPPLPTLNGRDRNEWIEFLGAIIHDTEEFGLSYSENRRRIQECLSGEVAVLFRGWTTFAWQFPDAFNRLVNMFGSPERLLGEAEDRINKLPPLRADLGNLARYTSEISYTLGAMQLAGESTHNSTLKRAVVRKLPQQLRIQWSKARRDGEGSNFVALQRFLERELKAALDANVSVMEDEKKTAKQPMFVVNGTIPDTTESQGNMNTTLPSLPSTAESRVTRRCEMGCNDTHKLPDCPIYLARTPTEWKTICFTHRLCYNCLNMHKLGVCYGPRCAIPGCGKKHHSTLHGAEAPTDVVSHAEGTPSAEASTSKVLVTHADGTRTDPFYRILPVRIRFNGAQVDTHVVLDSCSSVTIMTRGLGERLGVPLSDKTLGLSWFNAQGQAVRGTRMMIEVAGADGRWYQMGVYAGSDVSEFLPPQTVSSADLAALGINAKVPLLDGVSPDILVGLDNGHLSRIFEVEHSVNPGVSAVKTSLGWTLEGGSPNEAESAVMMVMRDIRLEKIVKDCIDADLLGNNEPCAWSGEEQRVPHLLEQSVVRVSDRYQCPMIWRDDNRVMPDSAVMARKRFAAFERRLRLNPTTECRVRELIEHYVEAGFAREVQAAEVDVSQSWYLPTFVVTNPHKPGKVRLV